MAFAVKMPSTNRGHRALSQKRQRGEVSFEQGMDTGHLESRLLRKRFQKGHILPNSLLLPL